MQTTATCAYPLAALVVLLVACHPQARSTSPDDIANARSLEKLMEIQQAVAEPQFRKIRQTTYGESDWPAFAESAARLQASSLKIKAFSKGAEFDALAMQLHGHAGELARAAAAKDSPATVRALKAMHGTCDGCHAQFR